MSFPLEKRAFPYFFFVVVRVLPPRKRQGREDSARTRDKLTWAHMFGAVWKSRSTATRTVFTRHRIPTGQDLSDSETRVFYVTAFCFLRSTLHRQRSGTWLREEQGRGGGTEKHGPLRWRVPPYLLSRSSRSPERVFEREGKSSPSPPHPYVRCPYSASRREVAGSPLFLARACVSIVRSELRLRQRTKSRAFVRTRIGRQKRHRVSRWI